MRKSTSSGRVLTSGVSPGRSSELLGKARWPALYRVEPAGAQKAVRAACTRHDQFFLPERSPHPWAWLGAH